MTDDWTPAEARIWARRLRKVGFSPVTLHAEAADTATPEPGRWYLRCNWPFDVADLPPDLYRYFSHRDLDDYDGRYENWGAVRTVLGRVGARELLNQFREVRLGMGSRPIPAVDADREPPFTTAGRVVADADDWPYDS